MKVLPRPDLDRALSEPLDKDVASTEYIYVRVIRKRSVSIRHLHVSTFV
jgi:hypothetical protein